MNQKPNATGTGYILFFQDLAPYGSYRFPMGYTETNRLVYKKSLLACPSEKTLSTAMPYCYGLNIDLDYRIQGEKARVRIQTLNNLATYVLMSDMLGNSTFYTHTKAKFEGTSKCNHRHDSYPNFLYADGHVEQYRDLMVGWGDPGGNTAQYNNMWFANGINPTRR